LFDRSGEKKQARIQKKRTAAFLKMTAVLLTDSKDL